MICAVCLRATRPRGTPADGRPVASSKTLCAACSQRRLRRGNFSGPAPRPVADDLLHEVEFFLEWCRMAPEDIPARLGMSRASFLTLIRRGVARGDVRAAAWAGRAGMAKGEAA